MALEEHLENVLGCGQLAVEGCVWEPGVHGVLRVRGWYLHGVDRVVISASLAA